MRIESFRMAYQPIVDITKNDILGYEALLRTNGTSPEKLFKAIKYDVKELVFVDVVARRLALNDFEERTETLFINCNPNTLIHDVTLIDDFLNRKHKGDVVVEVLEESIDDLPTFIYRCNELKEIGVKIALDDFGSNHSNLNRLLDVDFDYIKLDRKISNKVESSKQKTIIESVLHMTKQFSSRLIIEGIEKHIQYKIIEELGIVHAQGYLFGSPCPIEDMASLRTIMDKLSSLRIAVRGENTYV